MNRLRRIVYRLGFRPKPGTILYSPSLDLQIAGQQMLALFTAAADIDHPACPNCDADPQRCCREHHSHSMPHRGCILR